MFQSINPYNQELISVHHPQGEPELERIINNAEEVFSSWKKSPKLQRVGILNQIASNLRINKEKYALTMSLEMGKPINDAIAEVEKCAWVCEFYAEKGIEFLEDTHIATEAQQSFVKYEPLGVLFAIMPWNFPYWQFFRFAAPNIIAGNVILLKHAPNVFGCAKHIGEILDESGLPKGVFHNLFVDVDTAAKVIAHPNVKGVTLTGSTAAGSKVAELAGRHIKKTVLELGGNNASIVMEDADIEMAVESIFLSRMKNSGQSCIAAKRILLHQSIKKVFIEAITKKINQKLHSGNPVEKSTTFGPLARTDLAGTVSKQVETTINSGAEILLGGKQNGAYYSPTILDNVQSNSTAFNEEIFGPVLSLVSFQTVKEAIELANKTGYGLGTSIYTNAIDQALQMADNLNDGAVFINELVKSDPRLPFGGTKTSGYGRELALEGIREFVNSKTIVVR